MPRKSLFVLIALAAIAVLAGIYWFQTYRSPSTVTDELAAQGVDATPDNFIALIKNGDSGNVGRFIELGMNAGTQSQDGTSALIAAITSGNATITNQLLQTVSANNPAEASRMLNLQDSSGKTPLTAAVEHNDPMLVNTLLSLGADVSVTDNLQETPLLLAVKNKYSAMAQPIIDADIKQHGSATSINTPDKTSATALVYAIKQQDEKLVSILINAKADVSSADLSGTTPLMIAAETGSVPIAKALLAAGAKTDVADRAGNTPLSIALRHNKPDLVKFLIESGADADFHTSGELPVQIAIENEPFDAALVNYLVTQTKQLSVVATPLIFKALDNKDTDLVKALLVSGVSPKVVNANGETLLYHAVESGNEELALLLIDKGAPVEESGIAGISLLERAVKHNEAEVVKKLLSLGASPNQKTSEGYTVAEMAVYRGYPTVLDALLAKGAKIQKDFGVLWAIRDGGGKSVPVLLAYGAQPNVMNESGNPALWLAASAGEEDAVRALIQAKADINHPDKNQGLSPLAIAAHTGQLNTVKLLVEAGASLEAKDNFGLTALAHAAYMTKPDVVEYLISKGADTHATDKQGRSIMDLTGNATPSEGRDKILALLQGK